jgi:hypothetical protein
MATIAGTTCVSVETARAVATLASINNTQDAPFDFLSYGADDVAEGLSAVLYTLTHRSQPIDDEYVSSLGRHHGVAAVHALYALPEAIGRGLAPEYEPFAAQLAHITRQQRLNPQVSTREASTTTTNVPPPTNAPGADSHTTTRGTGNLACLSIGGLFIVGAILFAWRSLR